MIRFKKVVAVAVALALAALCIVGAPAQATNDKGRITFCHDGETKADMPLSAWNGHKGHENDYLGPCKPDPTPSVPPAEPTPDPAPPGEPEPKPTVDPTPEPTLASSPEPSEPEGPTTIGTPLTPEDDQPVTPQKRTTTHSERELAETGKKEEGVLVAGAIGVVLLGIGTAATLFARRREDRDG